MEWADGQSLGKTPEKLLREMPMSKVAAAVGETTPACGG
jgi:hypothetical protein